MESACWDGDGTIFANDTITGSLTYGLFVNKDNTVYMIDNRNRYLHVWQQDVAGIAKMVFNTLLSPISIFVTTNNDVFIGTLRGSVEKWALNATKGVVIMAFRSGCYALFVDIANNVYCSLFDEHSVGKQSLYAGANSPGIVAGTGDAGSKSDSLYEPRGIFVDVNFDLYVADSYNQRVQLFHLGEKNGITVAGNDKMSSNLFLKPTSVILDANKDLYIVDSVYSRIIRSNSNGFICIIGCSNVDSSAFHGLKVPIVAAFDTYGNIFVADRVNQGVKIFLLTTNTFSK